MIRSSELYEKALAVQSKEEADKLLAQLLVVSQEQYPDESVEAATARIKHNLGYCAGYYGDDVRARVEKYFETEHPVFGAIAIHGSPTPEQAFKMGVEAGEKLSRGENPFSEDTQKIPTRND